MTREEAEASIRAALATRDRGRESLSALAQVTRDNIFVGTVLAVADAYAAGDGDDVTLRRRHVLTRDGWRTP